MAKTPLARWQKFKPPKVLEVRHMRLEKDGTRYEAMAFRLKGEVSFGSLGSVTDGWLVIEHLHRRAYLYQPKGHLDEAYVWEKLCKGTHDLSSKDAENITKLLRQLIDRP